MEQKLTLELHEEHKTWLNKIAFYKDDLKIMRKRLEEIASKNTGKDVLALVEHFQNQFIVQDEAMDILKHDINDHETFIENKVNENSVALGKQKMHDHPKHRAEMEAFEKNFNSLRHEFIGFAAKWM